MKVNDQVNNIFEGDKDCRNFKVHEKPAKKKDITNPVRVHFGRQIFSFFKILDYFNDENLVYTL